MLTFMVSQYGGDTLVAGFDALTSRVNDLRPVWPDVRDLFYQFEQRAFETEGASSAAGRWVGLSERYSKWKARRYPGRRRLELTGALKASLTRTGFGSVVTMAPMRLEVVSDVSYAGYHQTGTPRMPKRAPVALRMDQVGAFGAAVHRWIDRDVMKSLVSRVAADQRRAMAGVR